jgi:SAM-dependent methyltransferase
MKWNRTAVQQFFNKKSTTYANGPFVRYLFTAREAAATHGDQLSGRHVLDLGCGTGRLYDHLKRIYPEGGFTYLGVDPSAGMLAASTIPVANQYCGVADDLMDYEDSFDRIYLLGVTTYLLPEQLLHDLKTLALKLSPDGQLIIHFTRKNALEVRLRQWLRPLLRRLVPDRGVVAGDFSIFPYAYDEARNLLPDWRVLRYEPLPATVPFLQLMSLTLVIWCSRQLGKWAPDWMRPDFLIVFGR